MLQNCALDRSKGGRPARIPGLPRSALIRARVLPQTADILKRAAGGSRGVPTLLDEIAQIIAHLRDVDGVANPNTDDGVQRLGGPGD